MDGGDYDCDIFVDLQVFDTVDHYILHKKLENYNNGLDLILVKENDMCQLIGLIRIWLALAAECLRVLHWVLYCF